MSKQRRETRPLEIWQKAKELRARWQKSIDETMTSESTVLGQGQTGEVDWSVAFPALLVIEDNPIGAMMANKSDQFSRICRLASEVRGWGREICGYHLNCWGSMFHGCQMDGSKFPMRDTLMARPKVASNSPMFL